MSELFLSSDQYERLWEGAEITLQVLGWAFLLGVVLSMVFGVARLAENRVVRGVALLYTELGRGISSIVLLFYMVFAIPILFEFDAPSRLMLGSVALGINMGAYGAELVRGAIVSVPRGQTEASVSLNLTSYQRLRHVVLPQAMRIILPPMGNLTIEILKGTALVSLVGLADITFAAQVIRGARLTSEDPVSVPILFLNVLVIYFVLAQVINGLFRLTERAVNRRYHEREGRAAVDPELVYAEAGMGGAGG